MPTHRSKQIAVLLGVTVLALVGAELALRLAGVPPGPSPYRIGGALEGGGIVLPDEELLYRLRPGSTFLGNYQLDDRGWRNTADVGGREEGIIRIVCMGDSSTFGLGVPVQDAWPQRLQQLLDVCFEGASRFEVINAGVPGYSSWQNRLLLQEDVLDLEPDVVVLLAPGANDACATGDLTDREAAEYNSSLAGRVQRLNLVRLLPRTRQSVEERPWGLAELHPDARRRVPEAGFRENLVSMQQQLDRAGVAFVLVEPPCSPGARALYESYERAADIVVHVAEEHDIPLAEARRDVAELEPYVAFIDTVHPDVLGHEVIALSTFETLVRSVTEVSGQRRSAFLRAWLTARREGVDVETMRSVCDAFPDLLGGILEMVGGDGDSSLPSDVALRLRALDPVDGEPRTPYEEGALLLRSLAARDEATAATMRSTASIMNACIVPADPFRSLLFGNEPATSVSAEHVTMARSLATFERHMGLVKRRIDSRLDTVAEMIASGQEELAEETLLSVLDLNPSEPRALHELSILQRNRGDDDLARDSVRRLIATAPDSAWGQLHRARRALARNDSIEAESLLRSAIAKDPALGPPRYVLGQLLLERGELEEAAVHLNTARAIGGVIADIPELLAQIHDQQLIASQ